MKTELKAHELRIGNLFYYDERIQIVEGVSIKIELKYIHELQNLYFALTGKELQFNLFSLWCVA